MTQDNRDKPQPEKAETKARSKSKTAPANSDAPIDEAPAPAAKPRARRPATPKTAAPGTTSPKAATSRPLTKPAASKSVTSKPAAAGKAAAPESPAPAKAGKSVTAKPAAAKPKAALKPKAVAHKVPAATPPEAAVQLQLKSPPPSAIAENLPVLDPPGNRRNPPPLSGNRSGNKSGWERGVLYWQLMRMHKPIGSLLLLWPTLWALWLAAKGMPRWDLLIVFVLGVFVMRSAGCVINDFADRKIDGQVKRTKDRPLVNGAVSSGEAIGLFIILCLVAFGLVLLTNKLTIQLSVGGLLLAFCYPFMKRYTHLPQVVLGAAFAWSIPMAFAAQSGSLGAEVWLLYTTVVLWTVVYDTFYAMVDRDDDRRIGVKSTAILFGEQDRIITGVLQALTLYGLAMVGSRFELGVYYYTGLAVAAGLFIYQQYLIRARARDACFKAFLNNNWVGAAVFAGILVDFLLRESL